MQGRMGIVRLCQRIVRRRRRKRRRRRHCMRGAVWSEASRPPPNRTRTDWLTKNSLYAPRISSLAEPAFSSSSSSTRNISEAGPLLSLSFGADDRCSSVCVCGVCVCVSECVMLDGSRKTFSRAGREGAVELRNWRASERKPTNLDMPVPRVRATRLRLCPPPQQEVPK